MIGHEVIRELSNHLWQSTVFAIAVALLTLAFRKNRAHVRYWLWFSAAVKFLVPFALLMNLGNSLWTAFAAKKIAAELAPPAVSLTVQNIAQPFSDGLSFVPSAPITHTANWIAVVLIGVWLCGFLGVALVRFRGWLRIRGVLRASTAIDIQAAAAVRSSPGLLEPGVVGVLRPVLLLPEEILKHMPQSQLETVLAHELSHIKRRDNLTATIHMVVEAVFWFHPFVWWIGARLIEERERACDEAVLSLGGEPRDYADAIVSVCKLYVESPLACVSGISGADLKKRIVRIMACHVGLNMSVGRKLLLGAAGLLAVIVPIVLGLAQAASGTSDWEKAAGSKQSFDVASIREDKSEIDQVSNVPLGPGDIFQPIHGFFSASNYPLIVYIRFAYKMTDNQSTAFQSQLPRWVMADRFDIQARVAGNPTRDQVRLMMQELLRDRFNLAVHHETKQVPVFALVLLKAGKTGPMLRPHAGGECSKAYPSDDTSAHLESAGVSGMFPTVCGGGVGMVPSGPNRRKMGARDVTMEFLATSITGIGSLGRPVLDETGLPGTFDFALEWTPESNGPKPSGADLAPDTSGLPFVEALKEQLGLKLKPERGSVNFLVFDHIEQPSPN